MNKKNIGAALSVVAAVTAGATVYASTINNLESDKNTNSMITPYYADTTYDYYSLVKSDYTNDLKNTSIANETRVVQNTNETREEVEKIEKAAYEIATRTINVTKANEVEEEEQVVYEVVEEVAYEPEVIEEEVYEAEVSEAINYVEETEVATAVENEEEVSSELVVYDDTNLDEILVDVNEEELEVKEPEVIEAQVSYLDENQAVELIKYINADALNVRSAKDMTDASNIVRTLVKGDEVTGIVDGEWFKTNEGYLSLAYLSDEKPVIEETPVEAVVETPVVEELAPVVEATPVVAETPVAEVKEEIAQPVVEATVSEQIVRGEAFTGYVYNTKVLNVRDAAKTGNIIGTIPTGTKVSGEIVDGWVRFDYNGKVAYVSAKYLTNTAQEVAAPVETAKAPVEEVKVVEQVVYEEEVVVEEAAPVVPQAPVVNNNGQQVASIASRYAGSPYVWGSSNPAVGFDCSGLVVNAYKQLGISLPHSSAAQYSSGYAVDKANLQPGDLVFFAIRGGGGIDHVGIVTSTDGTFIHASTPSTGVVFDNVYNNHYQKTFVGARRIF